MAGNGKGLSCFELSYRPVKNRQYGTVSAFLSELRVNDPELGILFPEDYRRVSERSDQCERLAVWAIEHAAEDIRKLDAKGIAFEWISVYVPCRLLKSETIFTALSEAVSDGISPDEFCLELGQDVLFDTDRELRESVVRIKNLGVNIVLNGLGKTFDPVLRVCELPFDYVVVDGEMQAALSSEDDRKAAVARSFFAMIESSGAIPIAGEVKNSEMLDTLPEGCFLYTGAAAGGFKKAQSIRN